MRELSKRKSFEEMKESINNINEDIIIIGECENGKYRKLICKCKICGNEWSGIYSNLLKGGGCKRCASNKLSELKVKSHGQYVKELFDKNENVIVVDDYINSAIKIKHKCLIHDFEWDARPRDMLRRGNGCPVCTKNKRREIFLKSHDEYVEELKYANPSIEVLETYLGNSIKIKHRCIVDGYEWYTIPSSTLLGYGCPVCGKVKRWTQEEYILKLEPRKILPIEEYINSSINIKHKCLVDGTEWMAAPSNILKGKGCPVCGLIKGGMSRRKLDEDYKFEVSKINSNIIVLEEYITMDIKIKHKCMLDEYEWMATPSGVLGTKYGCPMCARRESKGGYTPQIAEYNKEKWSLIYAEVYVIYCYNDFENFYKIGVTTKGVKHRFSYDMPYDYDVIKTIETNLFDAINTESSLHFEHSKYSYVPRKKFGGWTECFSEYIDKSSD